MRRARTESTPAATANYLIRAPNLVDRSQVLVGMVLTGR
jgi:hypothetical protein